MATSRNEIAQLAHAILGDPEENLDRFKEFFEFGNDPQDASVRAMALLSASAVMVDILPSLIAPSDGMEHDTDPTHKSSREQFAKQKRSKDVLSLFDQLVQKLTKHKIARGVCALLTSSVCSKHCLDAKRLQSLVSASISLACFPETSRTVCRALRERIESDLLNATENLEIVRLIVTSIAREKIHVRLNILLPIFENIRFSTTVGPSVHSTNHANAKIDKSLMKDLAMASGNYVDVKRVKTVEAQVLSEIVALYVRMIRTAQTGQLSFVAAKVCIEGIAVNAYSVNTDLATELEKELLDLARYYLNRTEDSAGDFGTLGAIALSALLNIAKGTKRVDVLSQSVIAGIENLVPIALDRLLMASTSTTRSGGSTAASTITTLCKGAIAVSSQFGSDSTLLWISRALAASLCMRMDEKSSVAAELLIHVAGRCALVQSAVDPDGVLVNGRDFTNEQISLFHPLALCGAIEGSATHSALVGGMSKYCKLLAKRDRAEALAEQTENKDQAEADRKRRRLAQPIDPKKKYFKK